MYSHNRSIPKIKNKFLQINSYDTGMINQHLKTFDKLCTSIILFLGGLPRFLLNNASNELN